MNIALSAGELSASEPLDHAVTLARSVSAAGLELWYPRHTGTDVSDALDRVRGQGLDVCCLSTATQLATEDRWDKDRSTLVDAVRAAAAHGVKLVNTYFGYPAVPDDARNVTVYAQRLRPVLELAADEGVTVLLENEYDSFGVKTWRSDVTRRPDALIDLVGTLDTPSFALTFDPCNAFFAGLDPVAEFLDVLGPTVRYVHVKDGQRLASGTRPGGWRSVVDSGANFGTCEVGEGELDWPLILDRLAQLGFDGWFALEPHAAPAVRDIAWRNATRFLLGHANSRTERTTRCV